MRPGKIKSILLGTIVSATLVLHGLAYSLPPEAGISQLIPRSGCKTVNVGLGDGCGALAAKCAISANDFTKYNPGDKLCSTLQVGQKVCCTSGGLAVPEKGSDGSCASYKVQDGDTCAVIAASNAITTKKIETYNEDTWGWTGCSRIQKGANICLSGGTPPMPATVKNAVCGPQVSGTVQPKNGTKLADLNPCPLNSCCDVWGQCGITSEYCTDTGTGAPGTAATGTNGCISNCGTDIANNGSAPSTFRRIAYWESFGMDRPCLNMGVNKIDTSRYTHVHFAFGAVSSSFEVDIDKYRVAFNQFVQLKGVKRIVSLGGWAFSTENATYNVFRQAVTSKNRESFATNVASFIKEWDLDGVDFDWEYPGEPDILGIPEGNDDDGENYSSFLSTLRKKLPDKSISVAAPASYWYLRGYPVADMDAALDYWVYMTYDLHGQWDHGSSWSDPGCPGGNCLRSHVNLTETLNSLAMITKAGVKSNKVVVGLSNYGRSFQMTAAGCTGPMCTYTGKESGATPGRCTNTPGLLADAEIYEIIKNDKTAKAWVDKDSNSNILVYDSDQWVAYMDAEIRESRTTLYKGMNLGGVVEWAVDLEQFESDATSSDPPTSTASGAFSTATIDSAVNPYLYACTKAQQKIVTEAWQEASELAQGHYQWSPGGKWQDAMSLYLGPKSKDDYSWVTGKGQLQRNIEREYLVHSSNFFQPPGSTYAYFYCDESKVPGGKKPKKGDLCAKQGVSAYTWDDPGSLWSAHYVVFCPIFFTRMRSLTEMVVSARNDKVMQQTIDYWKLVRSRSLFHETYHWRKTVSQPKCIDVQYDPRLIVKIGRLQPEDAAINAESYALAALSIYLQQTFKLSSPPQPQPKPDRPVSGDEVTVSGADITEMHLDAPPDGWEPPVINTSKTFEPDMTDTVRMSSVGALSASGPWDSCVEGLYQDMRQCKLFCAEENSSCTQSPTNLTIVCSGCVTRPATPVCKEGSYSNWDTCSAQCTGGSCFENAGEKGIQCEMCP